MKKILFSLALSALLFSCSESQENQNNEAQLIELSAIDFQSKIKEAKTLIRCSFNNFAKQGFAK